jgi:hypothetical protein
MFAPLEINSTTDLHDLAIGDRLYRNTYFTYFGTIGAGNPFQVKFLEPLCDLYFNQTGGDKVDAVSRQNVFDRIIKAADLLINLRLKWQQTLFCPKVTRSDTAAALPLAYGTWESFMSLIEHMGIRIPIISLNIAKLFTVVIQIGPGNIIARSRPSYIMLSSPYRPYSGNLWPAELDVFTGNLQDLVSQLAEEYDSKIFETQAKIPCVGFNRAMVESCTVIHSVSNLAEWYGAVVPFAKDVAAAETEYDFKADGTTGIRYNPAWGHIPDFLALAPLFRLSSATYGGLMKKQAISTGFISMQHIDCQVGGAWVESSSATVPYTLCPQLANLCLAQGDTTSYPVYRRAMHYKLVATILPSALSWNQRFYAYALTTGLLTNLIALPYAGFKPDLDIAVSAGTRGSNSGAGAATAQRQGQFMQTAGNLGPASLFAYMFGGGLQNENAGAGR